MANRENSDNPVLSDEDVTALYRRIHDATSFDDGLSKMEKDIHYRQNILNGMMTKYIYGRPALSRQEFIDLVHTECNKLKRLEMPETPNSALKQMIQSYYQKSIDKEMPDYIIYLHDHQGLSLSVEDFPTRYVKLKEEIDDAYLKDVTQGVRKDNLGRIVELQEASAQIQAFEKLIFVEALNAHEKWLIDCFDAVRQTSPHSTINAGAGGTAPFDSGTMRDAKNARTFLKLLKKRNKELGGELPPYNPDTLLTKAGIRDLATMLEESKLEPVSAETAQVWKTSVKIANMTLDFMIGKLKGRSHLKGSVFEAILNESKVKGLRMVLGNQDGEVKQLQEMAIALSQDALSSNYAEFLHHNELLIPGVGIDMQKYFWKKSEIDQAFKEGAPLRGITDAAEQIRQFETYMKLSELTDTISAARERFQYYDLMLAKQMNRGSGL